MTPSIAPENGWISVKDALPARRGEFIFVRERGKVKIRADIAFGMYRGITHWKPWDWMDFYD